MVGLVGLCGLVGTLVAPSATAQTPGLPDPNDIVTGVVRQVCDLAWIDGVCELFGYPEPQYQTNTDPSPANPLALRVGVLHNHSGYSDGDPDMRPSDYFTAGRTGHNTADAGGDTGIKIDYMISSEHSENEKIPITTAEVCLGAAPLECLNLDQPDHYRKWTETLQQAVAGTEMTGMDYTGFTAMRGFEYTNDIWNHLGVYFSRNVVNAKIDGSYLLPNLFWNWIREPAERGGGSDALVVFNHPGGVPNLTPFGDGALLGPILQLLFQGNWNNYRYVPDVDDRVAGMEITGGDDLSWFTRAVTNGWHIGPIAPEDEHQREWSTSSDGKTLMLTRGRSPRDYYWALQNSRTIAVGNDLVSGTPGQPAVVPSIQYWADGASVNAPGASPLGSRLVGNGVRTLNLDASGLIPGSKAVLVRAGGPPIALGTVGPGGTITATQLVAAPTTGEGWWFAVICGPDSTSCGTDEKYDAVTAPIWLRRP